MCDGKGKATACVGRSGAKELADVTIGRFSNHIGLRQLRERLSIRMFVQETDAAAGTFT